MTSSKNDHEQTLKDHQFEMLAAVLQALPAVVVAITVVAVVWVGWRKPRFESVETYKVAAKRSLKQEDLESAGLYLRKLAYLDPADRETQHTLALLAEQKGNLERARNLMQRLAPDDHAQYAPAHLWRAKQLLSEPRHDADQDRIRVEKIEQQLLFAVENDPGYYEAHIFLGRIYHDTGRMERAAHHLRQAVDRYPDWRLPLAKLYVVLADTHSAKRQGEIALGHYSAVLAEDDQNVDVRLQVADVQIFLEQFAAAESTLQRGLTENDDDRLRAALVGLYVTQFDRTEVPKLRRRLALLQQALEYDPKAAAVLERLALFADHTGPEAELAIEILQSSLARGDAPATVHFILGTIYTTAGDQQKALFHLEQGFRAHPNTPALANNLAWALANADPPQLERAFKLVDTALQASPNQPHMRDTRGVIYLKLGRFKEAVTDLEAALNRLPNDVRVRQHLATAYENLGQTELVKEQNRIIAALEELQQDEKPGPET